MGARDIMPFVSHAGAHHRIVSLPVGDDTSANTADTSWREGELVVLLTASNGIDVEGDGSTTPDADGLTYVAAGSSEGILRTVTGGTTTGDADQRMCPCYQIDLDTEFVTRNAFNNSDTNIGPAGSGAMTNVVVGASCGFWRDNTNPGPVSGDVNGDFGIDINTNGLVITRILDDQGDDIGVSGRTADKIVFKMVSLLA
jgi:hypothetical protein